MASGHLAAGRHRHASSSPSGCPVSTSAVGGVTVVDWVDHVRTGLGLSEDETSAVFRENAECVHGV